MTRELGPGLAALSRASRTLLGACALSVAAASAPLEAQDGTKPPGAIPVPWDVGERLRFDVRFGFIKAGSGEMTMLAVESVVPLIRQSPVLGFS